MDHAKRQYFDIEVDFSEILKNNGTIDEILWMKELKNRRLYLYDDIDQVSVGDPVKRIFQYNMDDAGIQPEERDPIIIYIASRGGEVYPGFELIDAIQTSTTPVYTVNVGYEYSMSFLIGLAGHKRFAMPNATFLMHDGNNMVFDSGSKAQDTMEFHRRLDERIKAYVISHTKITEKEYEDKQRFEWYMFAEEAKELGVTDAIVGVDCGIDAII